jgi:hypothetical protein
MSITKIVSMVRCFWQLLSTVLFASFARSGLPKFDHLKQGGVGWCTENIKFEYAVHQDKNLEWVCHSIMDCGHANSCTCSPYHCVKSWQDAIHRTILILLGMLKLSPNQSKKVARKQRQVLETLEGARLKARIVQYDYRIELAHLVAIACCDDDSSLCCLKKKVSRFR